jgi:hypothetical protein
MEVLYTAINKQGGRRKRKMSTAKEAAVAGEEGTEVVGPAEENIIVFDTTEPPVFSDSSVFSKSIVRSDRQKVASTLKESPEAESGEESSFVVIEDSASFALSTISTEGSAMFLMTEEGLQDDLAKKKSRAYSKCEHGRQKAYCKDCGGCRICVHGRQKPTCKDCGGVMICEHLRVRSRCKDCGGTSICEHKRLRANCKECKGKGICEHGRQRTKCADCIGDKICSHGVRKASCELCRGEFTACDHGAKKSSCKLCQTARKCQHGRCKSTCKVRNICFTGGCLHSILRNVKAPVLVSTASQGHCVKSAARQFRRSQSRCVRLSSWTSS